MDALQGRVGIVALLQQHDALDDVVVVDDLAVDAMNGLADLAQADLRPLHDRGDILDPQRRSIGRLENGLLNVLDIAKQSDLADVDLLLALLDKAAAGIDVVVGELLLHLADAQARRRSACWDRRAPGIRA